MAERSGTDEQNETSRPEMLRLRLYVAGRGPNSVQALANLRAICQEYLDADCYNLEVVDVFDEPQRALEDGVLVTPTLLKLSPPRVSIIGSLSEREKVVRMLGLAAR